MNVCSREPTCLRCRRLLYEVYHRFSFIRAYSAYRAEFFLRKAGDAALNQRRA